MIKASIDQKEGKGRKKMREREKEKMKDVRNEYNN
jgi:hypothetical protein